MSSTIARRALGAPRTISRVATPTRKTAGGRTRRDAVRGEVLDAIERLLQRESFTGLGVQQICDEADVARSAFYLNFANKSQALLRLVEVATAELFAVSLAWIQSDPEQGIDGLVRTHAETLRVWRRHGPVVAAYFEVSQYEPELAAFWQGQLGSLVAAMRLRIEASQQAGLASPLLDPAVCAGIIVHGAERLTATHVATRGVRDDAELSRGVAATIWTLLGLPAEPAR